MDDRVAPRRHSWLRRAGFRTAECLARWAGGRAFYRANYLRQGRFVVREERLAAAWLPAALDGFRIAQLSDLHAGPFLGPGDLADVVEEVARRSVDLVVLTGDFLTHQVSDSWLLLEDLARLRARHGVFAVFGNHDYRGRQETLLAQRYAQCGIRFLVDESVRLEHQGAGLWLTGLGDLEEARTVSVQQARRQVDPEEPQVVLAHHPLAGRLCAGARTLAVFTGHTHGTQIDLPFLRRLGPAHPGLRYFAGPTRVIVSRGLGVVGLPLRIGASAELVVAELVRAP